MPVVRTKAYILCSSFGSIPILKKLKIYQTLHSFHKENL